jgi:hypothetical protein
MSLSGFQRALAQLVLSAADIRRLASGDDSGLGAFDLTDRERERLRLAARQPGIWLCCSLARANRFEAIADAYPMTCVVLEPCLRELLDEVWSATPATNYQFQGEETLFASRVEAGLAAGTLTGEYLEEVFRYETACWGLAQWLRRADGADPPSATVEFSHAPDLLLEPLSRLVAPPPGLPRGKYLVEVRLENSDFSVEVLSAATDA